MSEQDKKSSPQRKQNELQNQYFGGNNYSNQKIVGSTILGQQPGPLTQNLGKQSFVNGQPNAYSTIQTGGSTNIPSGLGVTNSQYVGTSYGGQSFGKNSIRGESYFEYIPYEKSYVEQVPQTKIEYVPVEKKVTDYYAVEHQTEYIPQSRYETYIDYHPVQSVEYEAVYKTEYVPVEKVEYIPRTRTDYVGVERVEEKVDYQAITKQVVHGPPGGSSVLPNSSTIYQSQVDPSIKQSQAINPIRQSQALNQGNFEQNSQFLGGGQPQSSYVYGPYYAQQGPQQGSQQGPYQPQQTYQSGVYGAPQGFNYGGVQQSQQLGGYQDGGDEKKKD